MRILCVIAAVLALGVLSGCEKGKKVDLDAVDAPLRAMAERHDDYVDNDKKLSKVEKNIAKRTSELVIKTLDTAQGKTEKKASE
jgi:hypothetical protein